MSTVPVPASDRVADLLAEHRPGHALPQGFYTDEAVYRRDLERIFLADWLFVCHASELQGSGDFRLFEVAEESVIVVRGNDGELRALANVCRHRGSRVCEARSGTAKRFTCPYHGWTYGLDGTLRAARFTQPGFDPGEHGLLPLAVAEFHGLVMVCASDTPPPLSVAHEALDARLAPFDLARTRVAGSRSYTVDANWKLAIENYMECYHCGPAHPEYAQRHWLAQPRERWQAQMCEVDARSPLTGEAVDRYADRNDRGMHVFYGRTALREGVVTGSEDGSPVAPLLGTLPDYDGGATDFMLGISTYGLAYADHAILYAFLPRGPRRTEMRLTWLVHEDAREGVDYDRERLTWLWDVTSIADKRIIDLNQQGVNSRFYRPGPYSAMENEARRFADWYLSRIA